MSLLPGSVLDRAPGAKYRAALGFAELSLRAPLPRVPTLRRQRGELGPELQLSLRAPRSAVVGARGALRFDDELTASLEWFLQAADALAASALVIATPADITPGPRSRELLAAYFARLPARTQSGTELLRVWEPHGPWEPEDAHAVAAALDLCVSFDPLIEPRPPGPRLYARLTAMGVRQSFSEATFDTVIDKLLEQPCTRGYIAIDSPRSFQDAQRLQALLTDALTAHAATHDDAAIEPDLEPAQSPEHDEQHAHEDE